MHLLWLVAAAPAVPDASGGSNSESSIALIQYIRDGGVLSYVLIALSIAAVALIVRNALAFRRETLAPRAVVRELMLLLEDGRIADAEEFCALPANECYVTNVMSEALERCSTSQFGMLEFRSAVEEAARGQADEVHRLNDGIGIIAAVGPMLGLLGTVIGMIGAFRTIGAMQGAARSTELATFMSMALVNTAEGLIVAIPCTVVFSMFRRHLDRVLQKIGHDLERMTQLVVLAGESAGRPAKGPARAGARS